MTEPISWRDVVEWLVLPLLGVATVQLRQLVAQGRALEAAMMRVSRDLEAHAQRDDDRFLEKERALTEHGHRLDRLEGPRFHERDG